MAVLSDQAIDEVWHDLMSLFSASRSEIPITKTQLRVFLKDYVDAQLETFETGLVQSLPGGAGKTWLIQNPSIGRFFVREVMEKRRQEL